MSTEDFIRGKWDQVKGLVKEKWGKLSDDDVMQIAGSRERLIGKLEEAYGWEHQQAERQVDQLEMDSMRREIDIDDSERGRVFPL